MSAGVPDWGKLLQMGKLPWNQRKNIPLLAQLDEANKKIEELEAQINKLLDSSEELPLDDSFTVKCEVGDCEYVAKGKSESSAKNFLRMHNKSHLTDK